MENIRSPCTRQRDRRPLSLSTVNHHRNISSQVGYLLGDFAEPQFKSIKTGPYGSSVDDNLVARSGSPFLAFENCFKVPGFPAECNRQRFKGTRTAAAHHRLPLDFPHDRSRHLRTLRKLTLTPAKLADPLVDDPGNGGPVFRHAFRHLPTFRFQRRG